MIEKLVWDSHFFGFNVGKTICINENFIKYFLESDFNLVYCFLNEVPFSFPNCSSDLVDIKLIDIKVIFSKKIINASYEFEHVYEYDKEKDNMLSLEGLAIESGRFSRFNIDRNFDTETFRKFYSTWLTNSLNKVIADHVLIYKSENKIKGFLTLKLNREKATIGLISVDKEHRGENIGSILIGAAERIAFNNDITLLEVATQLDNVLACNFYIKNNFRIQEQLKIFHIWKNIK